MDDNDLYETIVGRDTGAQLRSVLEEIGRGLSLLTQAEQEFVTGFEGNLDLGFPVTEQNVRLLLQIRDALRHRIHLAQGSR